ncbi:MAG: hypothetical protein P4L69_07375 [Desulfosporosinus sp.]|nr:hypothetical protein [Desulfosporosinus sp.]
MAKSKITMNTKPLPIESNNYMSVLDFVKLHDSFVSQKLVEGLSQRTLQDYKKNMDYFIKWLEQSNGYQEAVGLIRYYLMSIPLI